jgi:acyl-homoserine lactone acylase PvdQ
VRRWIGIALLLLAAVVLVTAGLGLWWLQRSLPDYSDELALAGLERPVTVRYGAHAVPSIEAESIGDMLLAQGYVVARERLWQMDLLRRLAGGRLAEAFGAGALTADRFYRTVGLPSAAQRTFEALEPRWQGLLRRYAEGVNAYRERALAAGRLPLEYQLLGLTPAPWRPQDSLLVGAYMAWLNSVNVREELVFLRIAARLGTARALELFPTAPGVSAPAAAQELPDYRVAPATGTAALDAEVTALAQPAAAHRRQRPASSPADAAWPGAMIGAAPASQAASNAWAVTGANTQDGAALLANDPHLPAVMPATWYELEMQAPGYHAAGVALPGVPLILIGHNADLAWGITASVADTQDLFLERVGRDGRSVVRPDGRSEPIQVRVESIPVADRPSPVRLEIESTSHGVLIDALVAAADANPVGWPVIQRPERLALKLAFAAPDRSLVGFYRLNTASTIAEARDAARDLRQISLNLVLAHRNGRIGWQVSGLLPERGRGSGTFPVPGWEAGYGWSGSRPFAANPGVADPASNRLVSANNKMTDTTRPAMSHSWLAPFRARRIEALLRDQTAIDASTMARMQSDRVSREAQHYLDALRRQLAAIRAVDPAAATLAETRLLTWSGEFTDDSRPAAFFVLLRPALYQALYGDELGPDLPALMALEQVTYGPLAEAMRNDRSSFWDDVDTPNRREGPAHVWAEALHAAAAALREAVAGHETPTLAQLRAVTFAHAFDGQPVLGDLFNLGPVRRGGDNGTIDVAIAPLSQPRAIGNVASLRVVYTPSQWSRTRGTLPLGQSGHRLSRFRADQLDDWLGGELHAWPWGGPAAGQSLGTLTLLPASPSSAASAGFEPDHR